MKSIPMPKDGKGPKMMTGGEMPKTPEQQLKRVSGGASGSNKSPWTSGRKGRKG